MSDEEAVAALRYLAAIGAQILKDEADERERQARAEPEDSGRADAQSHGQNSKNREPRRASEITRA